MNKNHQPPTPEEIEEARLTAYALGQLDAAEREVVETLLTHDAGARQTVEETGRVARAVREAMRQGPPTGTSPALRSAVDHYLSSDQEAAGAEPAAEPAPSGPEREEAPARRSRRARWLALALAVCVLVGVTAVLYGPSYLAKQGVNNIAMTPSPSSAPATESASAVTPAETASGPRRYDVVADKAEEDVSRALTYAPQGAPPTFHDGAYPSGGTIAGAPADAYGMKQSGYGGIAAPSGPVPASPAPSTSPTSPASVAPSASWSMPASPAPSAGLAPSTSPTRPASRARADMPARPAAKPDPAAGRRSRMLARESARQAGAEVAESDREVKELWDGSQAPAASRPEPMAEGVRTEPADPFAAPLDAEPYHMTIESSPEGSPLKGRESRGLKEKEPVAEQLRGGGVDSLAARPSADRFSLEGEVALRDMDESELRLNEPAENRPAGGEGYAPIVENAFIAVMKQPVSTFSIDVDTASYANVRRFLREGRLPPPDAVRVEEMVNYFQYNYTAPEGDAPFAVHLEAAQCPWQSEHRLLRVGIKGKEVHRKERGASNLVFLIDVSGSMDDPKKLPLVKQGMLDLVEQLGADDRVAIVTYAGEAGLKLASTRGDQRETITEAIRSLRAGGSTHGSAGIMLAYEQATDNFIAKGNNRVILATDGDLNVGITRDDELVRLIEAEARTGVFLTVLGFGTGNLQDGKLEKLADRGNGMYAYIDDDIEARRVLVEQMTGSLVTIAKDVKIQVEFNPAEVAGYRLIGYENRALANADFDDDRKDAGEIGAGHTVTALYEIVPAADGEAAVSGGADLALRYQRPREQELTEEAKSGELATVRLRYKQPDADQSKLLSFSVADSSKRFGQASADFQFASGVAAFGMVLRGSHYCGATLPAVEEYALSGLGYDPGGYRAEFLELVRRAQQLRP